MKVNLIGLILGHCGRSLFNLTALKDGKELSAPDSLHTMIMEYAKLFNGGESDLVSLSRFVSIDRPTESEADQLRAKVDDLAALVRRLVWVLKKWNKNSELCESATEYLKRAGLVSVFREGDQPAVSEVDNLRAQVAALEAEVARLKEPVGLVWQSDGDGERIYSQKIGDHWYEVRQGLSNTWYGCFCNSKTTSLVKIERHTIESAKLYCAAHHLARYREMQGVS